MGKNNFEDVIKKVDGRLAKWKFDALSMAGRITLTKSVLMAIPTYTM